MSVTQTIRTAEQLLAAGDIGPCELVRGELIMMSPAGGNHGRIGSRLDMRLRLHAERHDLGEVLGAETGFVIARNPDTVRAPDVAFIRKERGKLAYEPGFIQGAPDLAAEVLSPDDTASEVLDKVQQWLTAGVIEVWVLDPRRKSVAVHRSDRAVALLKDSDELTAPELLGSFRVRVSELFD